VTADPNGVIAPIQSKAVPVILTTEEEFEVWMRAPCAEDYRPQRPLRAEAAEIDPLHRLSVLLRPRPNGSIRLCNMSATSSQSPATRHGLERSKIKRVGCRV
jgi:hypothetical protein